MIAYIQMGISIFRQVGSVIIVLIPEFFITMFVPQQPSYLFWRRSKQITNSIAFITNYNFSRFKPLQKPCTTKTCSTLDQTRSVTSQKEKDCRRGLVRQRVKGLNTIFRLANTSLLQVYYGLYTIDRKQHYMAQYMA